MPLSCIPACFEQRINLPVASYSSSSLSCLRGRRRRRCCYRRCHSDHHCHHHHRHVHHTIMTIITIAIRGSCRILIKGLPGLIEGVWTAHMDLGDFSLGWRPQAATPAKPAFDDDEEASVPGTLRDPTADGTYESKSRLTPCIYIYTCICIYVYIYMYIHIHIYIRYYRSS